MRTFGKPEDAFFQTSGAPGLCDLSAPINYPKPDDFTSNNSFSDLSLYVKQTIPPTVPSLGQKPQSRPLPVYRAYDVGVEFNENYVDLMYRMDGRGRANHLIRQQ